MNNKSLILSALFSIFCFSAMAQIEQDILRPSVNAEQFSLSVKAETALCNGQLMLDIPLMELKGKGYDLPISLMFYNGDVTFETEASPIGLGWALIAGGVITKTIRGVDDFESRLSNDHFSNGNYLYERLSDWRNHTEFASDIRVDPMPDEYTYSIPGHSGTIEVSMEGNTTIMEPYPDESYKIETTDRGYCMTTDDGTKFHFETAEYKSDGFITTSTSWFLTRIVTTKGGIFTFNYADEEYVDLTSREGVESFRKYLTKRITSIVSDFGSVIFQAANRRDRGSYGNCNITPGLESKRINNIELRDENNNFVKGFHLDNAGLISYSHAPDDNLWIRYRHNLSSITQYDANGIELPPYQFSYSYKFGNSRLAELAPNTNNYDLDVTSNSWSARIGAQAYVNLKENGDPYCFMMYPDTPYSYLEGLTIRNESSGATANDYFCLTNVIYPTGATEEFHYENHTFNSINHTYQPSSYDTKIHGKRLASRTCYSPELCKTTEYIYKLHDAEYNVIGQHSGIMTNPSIHGATYYSPQYDPTRSSSYLEATRLTSEKAFNTFMGPPVSYTEVEEIEKTLYGTILNRTIHYFEPQIVSPPENFLFVKPSQNQAPYLVSVGNWIYGKKTGYLNHMSGYNNTNLTYMAYPVGEFYNVAYIINKPLKEVFIGKDGKVRSIKEYTYTHGDNYTKYGYKLVSKNSNDSYNPGSSNVNYSIDLISKFDYITKRSRLRAIDTTLYFYDGNRCDSICELYSVDYNKGRVATTNYSRSNDRKTTKYYFPNDILNTIGNTSSPEITAINDMLEKNIIADPIKTIVKRNGVIIGGECRDYQSISDVPMLKSIYKLKNSNSNRDIQPRVSGNDIDYLADLYKEGEILRYDNNQNPEHIKINETQDRIYVWGYGGRFPIAVIDNLDYNTYSTLTPLRYRLQELTNFRKIETEQDCLNLRITNEGIRSLLPGGAHVTTFTYDPYIGITSEIDDANLGIIYTYDSFGRLSAKYDAYYNKTEEYNYNLYLQRQ